jgi:Methyltransferase domain
LATPTDNVVMATLTLAAPAKREDGQVGRLPVVELGAILSGAPSISLHRLRCVDGNVSLYEQMCIAALAADKQPQCAVEIGTFNGNTTMQIAANVPENAVVFTLDLPVDQTIGPESLDNEDEKYVASGQRKNRVYARMPLRSRIRELFGDSVTFDFDAALEGRKIDFVFIDASHSYENVKRDTENILPRLADSAIVLWHDYQPFWHGVCRYLNELSRTLPIKQIGGTLLGYYRKP